MRFVFFADVCGEPAALQALLQVVARQPSAELVCLGGAVESSTARRPHTVGGSVPGPDAQATLETMRRKGVHLVAGPAERAFAKSDDAGALKPAEFAYLRAASPPRRFRHAGKLVLATTEATGAADLVISPALLGSLAADSSYATLEDDGSLVRRTFTWATPST